MATFRSFLPLALGCAASCLAPVTARAQTLPPVAEATTTYEIVEDTVVDDERGSDRFVASALADAHLEATAIAAFGPFRVLDPHRAALVAGTNAGSPRALAAMLAVYPGIAVIEMVECPGTDDDNANLRLGRMIRRAGIATHVPAGGSVRSGAVELFLAGSRRSADLGAEFAVHSWEDENGREPADFAPSDPVNQAYIAYYRDMGMSDAQAQAFYAMTNSVPNAEARWLSVAEMKRYAALD